MHIRTVVLFFALLTASTALANPISVYDQPNTDANVTHTLNKTQHLIPFYRSKKGDWIKVANPKTGDVGWIKATSFKATPQTHMEKEFSAMQDDMHRMMRRFFRGVLYFQRMMPGLLQEMNDDSADMYGVPMLEKRKEQPSLWKRMKEKMKRSDDT